MEKNGKAEEIEKIFKVLNKNGITNEAIENCLSVLARRKAEEIERIFKVLNENGISNKAIENCLVVLARGRSEEIEKIFKVLEKNNIKKEAIEKCLYVLAQGKAEEIEKIFKVLNDNEISEENINDNLGWLLSKKSNYVKDIFSNNIELINRYIILKGYYNRVISISEIKDICKEKQIELKQFLASIRGEQYVKLYIETLKNKQGIYIGKSIPIDNMSLRKYGQELLEISKMVSKNFCYKYRFNDLSEIESFAMEIIIEKCGDIIYNSDFNEEKMKAFIYKKVFNSLKIIFKSKEIVMDIENMKKHAKYNDASGEDELDLSDWDVNSKQKEILNCISKFLETGKQIKDIIEDVSDILKIDEEEIIIELEKVKSQLIKQRETKEKSR